jgi:transcription elongation factor Elf1
VYDINDKLIIKENQVAKQKKIKMFDCPFCRGKKMEVAHAGDTWWTRCLECGASGPATKKPTQAIRRWNRANRLDQEK